MPMGMNPINFQLIRANEKTRELQTSDIDNLDMAYKNIKSLCQFEATMECEEAMKRYYDLKVKQEDEEEAAPHEKLFKLVRVFCETASHDLVIYFCQPIISY